MSLGTLAPNPGVSANGRPTARRKIVPVPEFGEVPIDLEEVARGGRLVIYPEVMGKDYFDVRVKAGTIVLAARGWVGQIPLNDAVAINVAPRVGVAALTHLIGVAEGIVVPMEPAFREYGATEVVPD